MNLVIAIFLFTCNISFVYLSCPENEVSVFCDGAALIPQVYCGGVGHEEKYKCSKKQNVRCGCGPGYAREHDHQCVRVEDCKVGLYELKLPGVFANKGDSGNKQDGSASQGTGSKLNKVGQKVLQFIKSPRDIFLVRLSEDAGKIDDCVCLKSAYGASGDHDVERTLTCYKCVPSSTAPGTKAKVPSDRGLIIKKQHVTFNVSSRQDMTVVTVEYASLPNTVTHLNEGQSYLSGEFVVVDVSDECLVVKLMSENAGGASCLIWEIITDEDAQPSGCTPMLLPICGSDFYDMTTDVPACRRKDAAERRAEKLANQALTEERFAISQL
ncbi:uncharacterized protein [Dermacentor andersoni]|uniref:uncharacterized protein isoform X1 n=1 Tax=Dermacentor andersoni TaxID=34620 RepID=UPI002416010B|nr:uncharacterized protein LOC129384356 isoform X1 [Dermacentor andersoni]